MDNKKNKEKINNNFFENKSVKWYYFLPLLIIVAIIPLIVRGKYISLKGVQKLFWSGEDYHLDLYSYWKAFWTIAMGIISFITFLGLFIDKKILLKSNKYYKYYISLAIYALFVIISSATSNYPEIAYGGFVEQYQGMYVLLSYVLLTFLTINYINNESNIKLFSKAFIFLIMLEGTLGLGQYFGADFLQSKLGMDLMVPSDLVIESSNNIFGKYTIYGTLYNSNFVGSFAAIVVPLSIAFYINSSTKKAKIISAISMFLSACLWIGCNSRAGYVGLITAGTISIILLRKQIIKNYKFVLILMGGLLFIIISFNIVSDGRVLGQFSRLNLVKEIDGIEEINSSAEKVAFKDIILEKDAFTIVTNLETLTVKLVDNEFIFLDENKSKVDIYIDEDNYIILKDEKYKNYKLVTDAERIHVKAHNRVIEFYFTEDGVKISGNGLRLSKPIVAPKFKFLDSYDKFASGRGYIWSRSIMMLPKVIFKGHGPDTFIVAFPQDDFVEKLNNEWNASILIDKPHNMYLQIAINTGIISLIALLILWGIYLISSIKLYRKTIYDSIEKTMGFACFIAVVAYLVAGIFNDQIVSVAPLFWIVLGIGISINEKLIRKS